MNDDLGKQAERKIREWLDKPEDGISFDRIPDQMTGFYGSKNICDFTCFKSPFMYYIESKATWNDRFDFSMITDTQREGLLKKSRIPFVRGIVIVLFASYKRAFMIDIRSIVKSIESRNKSVNINRLNKSQVRMSEIETIQNSRKTFLDYKGDIEEYFQKCKFEECKL